MLLKALLSGGASLQSYGGYLAPVIISSIFYSVVALNWAISLFDREEVLFREAERFDLGLWIKHILREKEPVPSRTEAALCFTLILLAQFAAMSYMQSAIFKMPEGAQRHVSMLRLQTIYLIATVGAPPLLMAVLLTSSFRRTLKLYWPKWQYLVLGVVLPVALQPIAIEIIHQLDWFSRSLPLRWPTC